MPVVLKKGGFGVTNGANVTKGRRNAEAFVAQQQQKWYRNSNHEATKPPRPRLRNIFHSVVVNVLYKILIKTLFVFHIQYYTSFFNFCALRSMEWFVPEISFKMDKASIYKRVILLRPSFIPFSCSNCLSKRDTTTRAVPSSLAICSCVIASSLLCATCDFF